MTKRRKTKKEMQAQLDAATARQRELRAAKIANGYRQVAVFLPPQAVSSLDYLIEKRNGNNTSVIEHSLVEQARVEGMK